MVTDHEIANLLDKFCHYISHLKLFENNFSSLIFSLSAQLFVDQLYVNWFNTSQVEHSNFTAHKQLSRYRPHHHT